MKSNIITAEQLEQNLLFHYGTGIAELREYATSLGVDITIQIDGLWISRPGYGKALQPNMPIEPLDWRCGLLHDNIRVCADILWEKNDPKPTFPR